MEKRTLLLAAIVTLFLVQIVSANDVGTGIGVTVGTEPFAPLIWMCDSRIVTDDNTENGNNTLSLTERKHNYAFEGEQIHWKVLVMDKNKIEQITEVVGTIGSSQGTGNDVEVECKRTNETGIDESCNARILEEQLVNFDRSVMSYYDCTFTVETPASMQGEYYITIEVMDSTGLSNIMDETEYWFLNPVLNLGVDGTIDFNNVRPGTQAYSSVVLLRNDAEAGSGVMLDMFISGTDFYDPAASGAACPNTNQLALTKFAYYVTNGAYSSNGQLETDAEGYTAIPYSTDISGSKRIVRWTSQIRGASPSSSVVEQDWNNGNVLSPGSEMALVFRLALPEPCVGDFSEGQIFFYGEAI